MKITKEWEETYASAPPDLKESMDYVRKTHEEWHTYSEGQKSKHKRKWKKFCDLMERLLAEEAKHHSSGNS